MLICMSGIDGGGKTTQVNLLKETLEARGHRVVVTKAYSDAMKELLRTLVHTWADEARMFLFQAMHARQYDETQEALAQGSVVIADRWDESYLAYHRNFGPLADKAEVRTAMNQLAFRDTVPDVGFLIWIPVEIARERREARGNVEKLENRPDEWYTTIQEGYLRVARERNWHVIDGLLDKETMHRRIVDLLLPM